ncbi:hypothetical protein JQM63_02310 [Oscillibacter valericigenes]|nr:hypothetical protein [Oscillibacter valericigenes]
MNSIIQNFQAKRNGQTEKRAENLAKNPKNILGKAEKRQKNRQKSKQKVCPRGQTFCRCCIDRSLFDY